MIDYHRIMDFSRPENARMINRLKVLSALRQKSASKAELADTLDINKVSVGEICRQLEKDGLIEASGKVRGASGRPGTILSISGKAGRVFSLTVSRKTASIAAADISGRLLRFERFPRTENFSTDLVNIIRKLSGNTPVYGIAMISEEDIPLDIAIPMIKLHPAVAEAEAEIARLRLSEPFLFISWGYSVSAAFAQNGRAIILPEFSHMRVSRDGNCACGGKGCLEAVSSGRVLMERNGIDSLRKLAQDSQTMKKALQPMAAAITEGVQALSAESAIITGPLSQMSDSPAKKKQCDHLQIRSRRKRSRRRRRDTRARCILLQDKAPFRTQSYRKCLVPFDLKMKYDVSRMRYRSHSPDHPAASDDITAGNTANTTERTIEITRGSGM